MLNTGKVGFDHSNPIHGQLQVGNDGVANGLTIYNSTDGSFRLFRDQNWGYLTRSGTIDRGIAIGSWGQVNFDGSNGDDWANFVTSRVDVNKSKTFIVQLGTEHNFFVRGDGHVWARGVYLTSDQDTKENIKELTNTDGLFDLRAFSYNYKTPIIDDVIEEYDEDSGKLLSTTAINDKDYVPPTHFGYLAQELKGIYPELVEADEKDCLSINYIGLIPLITEALKEQRSQINYLKEEVTRISANKTAIDNSYRLSATLYQNTPNPFSINTDINYFLENDINSAILYIYDLSGKQIKSFKLNERGEGNITIYGSELNAGIYLYSLIVDGKEIDTKRLILTD